MMSVLAWMVSACGSDKAKNAGKTEQQERTDGVEVLYFHGKQRCPTCKAIEDETQRLVEAKYARQLEEGALAFKSVDITEDEALADKYEVTWSSLIVVDYDEGKETAENMTEFAFANARTAPTRFGKNWPHR